MVIRARDQTAVATPAIAMECAVSQLWQSQCDARSIRTCRRGDVTQRVAEL